MLCAELMETDPQFLVESDVAQAAAQRMRDFDVSFLPVCDATRKVRGTLTAHELVTRVCADDRPASTSRLLEVMSDSFTSCRPADDVQVALEHMRSLGIDHVVVIDDEGHLRGVLSQAAISHAHAKQVGTMREGFARRLRSDD